MISRYLEWHEPKRHANFLKHGVDFGDVAKFVWDQALIRPDTRRNYYESRWIALGPIEQRLHVLVYTERLNAIRLISVRKANYREFLYYVSQTDTAN